MVGQILNIITILLINIAVAVVFYYLMMYLGMRKLHNKFRTCKVCKETKCVLEFTRSKSDICNQCFDKIVEKKSRENPSPPQS